MTVASPSARSVPHVARRVEWRGSSDSRCYSNGSNPSRETVYIQIHCTHLVVSLDSLSKTAMTQQIHRSSTAMTQQTSGTEANVLLTFVLWMHNLNRPTICLPIFPSITTQWLVEGFTWISHDFLMVMFWCFINVTPCYSCYYVL